MIKVLSWPIIISLFCSLSQASDSMPLTESYSQLLNRHQQQGHLNQKELKIQQLQYSNDKAWQTQFKKQVRGVASSLTIPREKISLNNPAIEIAVK
jgi:hypothetical protein